MPLVLNSLLEPLLRDTEHLAGQAWLAAAMHSAGERIGADCVILLPAVSADSEGIEIGPIVWRSQTGAVQWPARAVWTQLVPLLQHGERALGNRAHAPGRYLEVFEQAGLLRPEGCLVSVLRDQNVDLAHLAALYLNGFPQDRSATAQTVALEVAARFMCTELAELRLINNSEKNAASTTDIAVALGLWPPIFIGSAWIDGRTGLPGARSMIRRCLRLHSACRTGGSTYGFALMEFERRTLASIRDTLALDDLDAPDFAHALEAAVAAVGASVFKTGRNRYAMLKPDCVDLTDMVQNMEALRFTVRHELQIPNRAPQRLYASIGATAMRAGDDSFELVFRRAGRALRIAQVREPACLASL